MTFLRHLEVLNLLSETISSLATASNYPAGNGGAEILRRIDPKLAWSDAIPSTAANPVPVVSEAQNDDYSISRHANGVSVEEPKNTQCLD
jgi:hypothetical protein